MKLAAARPLPLVGALLVAQGDAAALRGVSDERRGLSVDGGEKYGSDECPCIGFDGVEGETVADVNGTEVKYPADLGGSCEAWDKGTSPECKGDSPPGWCKEKWCYVDPRKCKIDVSPKMSPPETSYQPDARYRNLPLYYSYSTCGSEDSWASEQPDVGISGCRCIGIDNSPGTTTAKVGGKEVDYPAEIGGECKAWDAGRHPDCEGDDAPEWCAKKWCYVDPCSCGADAPPKPSDMLEGATFQGRQIFYSYATCGEKDAYSTEAKVKAAKAEISQVCKEGYEHPEEWDEEIGNHSYNYSGYKKEWQSEWKNGDYPSWKETATTHF